MPLKEAIIAQARHLGFPLAGVTTPDPPPHWPVMQNWLALGRNASMEYLRDARRRDPRLLMVECQSILVLGSPHPPAQDPAQPTAGSLQGCVAAYAGGRDYHLVLGEKLAQLVAFIQEISGEPVPCRGYTDSGPLLERDLAQRAGLGWIGRNTCLIHPQAGSYFFLAEILLGLKLEPDPPFSQDRCGTCTRCVEACPTGCILPDRTLDARRCISYLTIENKGDIPADLRPLLENRIFGCDLCQQVCPWNRRAGAPPAGLEPDPAFAPQPGRLAPQLLSEILLTDETFRHQYSASPLLRAKRGGYLRNIAVALGNAADPRAIPALEQAARDGNALIQRHARWALEQIARGRPVTK